jgi:hypothetical protein
MDQQAFVNALKTQDIETTKGGNRPLTAAETTKFRSILGGITLAYGHTFGPDSRGGHPSVQGHQGHCE